MTSDYFEIDIGGQHGTMVKHLSGNQKDVGSNHTTVREREKKSYWEAHCTEGAPMVQQDLRGRSDVES